PGLHPGLWPVPPRHDLSPLSGRRGLGLSGRRPGRELSARGRHRPGPDPHRRRRASGRQCRHHELQPPAQHPAFL
ncbi:hypothetical protein LTR94_029886, partial [Friedmanniomyces endolithicus]